MIYKLSIILEINGEHREIENIFILEQKYVEHNKTRHGNFFYDRLKNNE